MRLRLCFILALFCSLITWLEAEPVTTYSTPTAHKQVDLGRQTVPGQELLANTESAASKVQAPAVPVKVGLYLVQLTGLDIKANSFNVDFYVWFRWNDSTLKPYETWELTNGRVTNKSLLTVKNIGAEQYAAIRVQAQITQFWDLRNYPLDSQLLQIRLEDSVNEVDRLRYVADLENSNHDPDLSFPGWNLQNHQLLAESHRYQTNYGDPTISSKEAGSEYSRVVYTLPIARPKLARFVKVFFPLLIATSVSWLAFLIQPKDLPPRISIGVGALFAAAAASLSINAALPDISVTTTADRLIILCLGQIFTSCLVTVISMTLLARDKGNLATKLDRFCAFCFPGVFLVILISYVL